MEQEVEIAYVIDDDEWKRTASKRRTNIFPLNDCFFGHVSFRIGHQQVLGTERFDMSVADLAVGLSCIVRELRSGAYGVLMFLQSDDMLEISFQVGLDFVTVSSNLALNQSWTCNQRVLEKAIVEFISSFATEAKGKVLDLFAWGEMDMLRSFQK